MEKYECMLMARRCTERIRFTGGTDLLAENERIMNAIPAELNAACVEVRGDK